MRGVRFRLHMIVAISMSSAAYFTFQAYSTKEALAEAQAKVSKSLSIRSIALDVQQSLIDRTEAGRELASLKSIAENDLRRSAISDILHSLEANDRPGVRARAQVLAEQEGVMFKELSRQREETWQVVELDIGLALISLLVGFSVFLVVVKFRVLRPLDRLSRRMMDFLVDRYSFQFADPDLNELGDLQRTFNALAQRVINTMDELKTLDQAKSDFLNIATHELRTPLTSIKGSLSLLDSGVMGHVDPNCLRLIKIAEVETDRLIRLINELLDLAKIEAGKLPLACSWLSWDELTSKTSEGLIGLAHKANINVKVDSSQGLEVFMDRDRVQQILTNLISNAIKFSPEGSWVHVSVGRSSKGEVLVNVRDQGPGISLEEQKRIFQKFRQGDAPENPLVKGTGLGLAIAKALVAEHGGEIGVESTLGEGSTFWFTLPQWRDEEASSDELTPPPFPRVA